MWYKRVLKTILAVDVLFVLICSWLGFCQEQNMSNSDFIIGRYQLNNQIKETISYSNTSENKTSDIAEKSVYVMGNTAGIYVNTEGILVIDTSVVVDSDGTEREPAKDILLPGDYIVSMNHQTMKTKKQLIESITNSDGSPILFMIKRKDAFKEVKITPIRCLDQTYKVGIWVRDNLQGLGTITYLDDNQYGALGHSINDIDTGELLDVSNGHLYEADIYGLKRGLKGNPGIIEGMITYDDSNILGTISGNHTYGISGVINDEWLRKHPLESMDYKKIGTPQVGAAQIQSYVSGEKRIYDIFIQKIHKDQGQKSFEIEVQDETLIALTGGIIQGMSGSPIIQDGKLIGAVTHVFVDDPTRGYGIFIEEMLE